MPRGIKKQINYPEEIERIEARIIHHTNSIKELKERKQSLCYLSVCFSIVCLI